MTSWTIRSGLWLNGGPLSVTATPLGVRVSAIYPPTDYSLTLDERSEIALTVARAWELLADGSDPEDAEEQAIEDVRRRLYG